MTARANRTGDESTSDASFTDVQRRKVHYEAGLKALEYGRQTGQLVAIGQVDSVIAEVAEESKLPIVQIRT